MVIKDGRTATRIIMLMTAQAFILVETPEDVPIVGRFVGIFPTFEPKVNDLIGCVGEIVATGVGVRRVGSRRKGTVFLFTSGELAG